MTALNADFADDPGDDDPDQDDMEGAEAIMYRDNYRNPTANKIDEAVQTSKRNQRPGPDPEAAQRLVLSAQRELETAKQAYAKAIVEAGRPELNANPQATQGLRLLRQVANSNEEAGKYAVWLLMRLTREQFEAVKPRLDSLPSATPPLPY